MTLDKTLELQTKSADDSLKFGFGLMESQDRAALDLWRDITQSSLRAQGPDLTARQTAILLTLHLDEEPHTVRGLAKRLALKKPAVVRALDSLQSLGLIERLRDQKDKRNIFIQPTLEGIGRLSNIAQIIAANLASLNEIAAAKNNYISTENKIFDSQNFAAQ